MYWSLDRSHGVGGIALAAVLLVPNMVAMVGLS
jgi:hypothetical protein